MLLTNQHPKNKSIMVAVLGRPNAGKSSLINRLIGHDLSIVSHRPQTTRHQFHCTMVKGHTEIIFVDTPGIHRSNQEINKRMNAQARDGSEGADLNLLLLDCSQNPAEQMAEFFKVLDRTLGPTWLVFSKSDLVPALKPEDFKEFFEQAKQMHPCFEGMFLISSQEGVGLLNLIDQLSRKAESGPHLYPGGEFSNKNERFFVAEYIRVQAFELLKEELPYELAVTVEDFKDLREEAEEEGETREEDSVACRISATIIVNRPSQRAIVVGAGGSMIKEIGIRARQKIEALVGGKIMLNLHVKVQPKWFRNHFILHELGLPRAHDSNRVWRAQ